VHRRIDDLELRNLCRAELDQGFGGRELGLARWREDAAIDTKTRTIAKFNFDHSAVIDTPRSPIACSCHGRQLWGREVVVNANHTDRDELGESGARNSCHRLRSPSETPVVNYAPGDPVLSCHRGDVRAGSIGLR
jgi:hypothetical protein